MILNGIFEIFTCPMIILEIKDQKSAGIALLGNSRVLKFDRKRSNLGDSDAVIGREELSARGSGIWVN